MSIATVVVPSSWQTCKTEIKDYIEQYARLCEPPFRVNIMGGGKVNRVEIKDCRKLKKDQRQVLNYAITEFNDRAENRPQDPCAVATNFRRELEERSTEIDKLAFREVMRKKVLPIRF